MPRWRVPFYFEFDAEHGDLHSAYEEVGDTVGDWLAMFNNGGGFVNAELVTVEIPETSEVEEVH